MVQVNAEIPDSKIDEAVQKEFKTLQKEIKSLQGKNARLETKIRKLERKIENNKDTVLTAWSMVEAVKLAGSFKTYEEWEDC